jgi:Zn-dependent peptidase ImmA (M78 family)/DNA-binding XRE family transcriptional regulator
MNYNPQMLKLARELRGYTQTQLSELLGVAQGTVSKIEKMGFGFDDQIARAAGKCLNVPISFFENQDVIIPIQGEYRKKSTTSVKQFNQNNAKMIIAERQFLKLLDGVELSGNEIPVWDVELQGSPEMCAQYIRKLWRIPRGRVEDISKTVENNGAVIIPVSLTDMDGFSMYTTNGVPLIFVNKHISADRARLTVAHELGHIIMHLSCQIDPSRSKEQEAFRFGAEFLMPENEIKPQLFRLNLRILADLKKYWKTSMAAIIYRAKYLGAINENQAKYLRMQMGAEGYRLKEPVFFSAEQPSVLREMIEAYTDDLGYSTDEIATLIDSSIEDFRDFYLQDRTFVLRKIV